LSEIERVRVCVPAAPQVYVVVDVFLLAKVPAVGLEV